MTVSWTSSHDPDMSMHPLTRVAASPQAGTVPDHPTWVLAQPTGSPSSGVQLPKSVHRLVS